MVDIKGVAHFSIPVSDIAKSRDFYTEIVGCTHISTTPPQTMAFLDAGGVCVILCKSSPPINSSLDDHEGVHHSFLLEDNAAYKAAIENLGANGVEVFFEEDRQGGVVNGPRCYFRDPDGTVLEYIDLTSYAGAES